MVVRQRHVHHGPGDDFAVHHHGPLHDAVHPEDGGLRRVDDGGTVEGPEDAAVGDGERAAGHLIDGQSAVLGLLAVRRDGSLDVGEGHRVHVA